MAFWGVEVKTGKPFTHSSQNVKGRLRISQATLGMGSLTQKSLVQCNVGKKSPVLICVLVPDKAESCHLDLEFDEVDNVVFSVIGPRSVYLTGYYVGNSHHHNIPSDTESYGEDIGDSDGLDNCSEEDDYEDSFIDDDDEPNHSPVSSQNTERESSVEHIPKGRKLVRKCLKKRCRVIDSDDEIVAGEGCDNLVLSSLKSNNSDKSVAGEGCDKPKADGQSVNIIDDSDDEEIFTFATFKNNNTNGNKADGQSGKPNVNFGAEVKNANNVCKDIVLAKNEQISEIDAVKCEKPMKKKEGSEDVKCQVIMNGVREENPEDKSDNVKQDPLKKINEMEIDGHSGDMGSGKSPKSKKRKKSEKGSTAKREVKGCTDNTDEVQPPSIHNVSDVKPDQQADVFMPENKIKKKKKKNSANEDNVGNVGEPENAQVKLFSDLENKEEEDLTTVSTLSNGLVVIELSKGKLEGKVAATGKKVKKAP